MSPRPFPAPPGSARRKELEADTGGGVGRQEADPHALADREAVTALIEVKVTPQRGDGFDRVAERIYQYDEVESVYLMSGAFDLTVIISGRTLKEVAQFVGERLSTLEDVTGTATHFILHKYKEKHLIFEKQEQQEKEWIFS